MDASAWQCSQCGKFYGHGVGGWFCSQCNAPRFPQMKASSSNNYPQMSRRRDTPKNTILSYNSSYHTNYNNHNECHKWNHSLCGNAPTLNSNNSTNTNINAYQTNVGNSSLPPPQTTNYQSHATGPSHDDVPPATKNPMERESCESFDVAMASSRQDRSQHRPMAPDQSVLNSSSSSSHANVSHSHLQVPQSKSPNNSKSPVVSPLRAPQGKGDFAHSWRPFSESPFFPGLEENGSGPAAMSPFALNGMNAMNTMKTSGPMKNANANATNGILWTQKSVFFNSSKCVVCDENVDDSHARVHPRHVLDKFVISNVSGANNKIVLKACKANTIIYCVKNLEALGSEMKEVEEYMRESEKTRLNPVTLWDLSAAEDEKNDDWCLFGKVKGADRSQYGLNIIKGLYAVGQHYSKGSGNIMIIADDENQAQAAAFVYCASLWIDMGWEQTRANKQNRATNFQVCNVRSRLRRIPEICEYINKCNLGQECIAFAEALKLLTGLHHNCGECMRNAGVTDDKIESFQDNVFKLGYCAAGRQSFHSKQTAFVDNFLCIREEQMRDEEEKRRAEQRRVEEQERQRRIDLMLSKVHGIRNEMLLSDGKKMDAKIALFYDVNSIIVCAAKGKRSSLYAKMVGVQQNLMSLYGKQLDVVCVSLGNDWEHSLLMYDFIENEETNVVSGVKMIANGLRAGGRVAICSEEGAFNVAGALIAAFLMCNNGSNFNAAIGEVEDLVQGIDLNRYARHLNILQVGLSAVRGGQIGLLWKEVKEAGLIECDLWKGFDEFCDDFGKLLKLGYVQTSVIRDCEMKKCLESVKSMGMIGNEKGKEKGKGKEEVIRGKEKGSGNGSKMELDSIQYF